MSQSVFFWNIFLIVISGMYGRDLSDNIENYASELIERKVSQLFNQKLEAIHKQHELVTNNIRREIELLKREDIKHKQEYAKLKHENEEQTALIQNLQNDLDSLKRNCGRTPFLEEHIPKGHDFIQHNLTGTFTENQSGANLTGPPIPTALLHRRRAGPANIAFCAYLSTTNSHMTGEAVKFDKVLLNDGGGYNSYTGAFTAPLSGVYLFTFHFDTRKLTFLRLVINGVNQVDAVANQHTYQDSRGSQSMGGNTAIVHVNHGQAVLVEVFELSNSEEASSEQFRWSTFSGVLLY